MSEFWKNLGSGILDSAGNALSGGLSSAVSGLVNGAIGAIFRPSLRQQINSQKELMQEQARINKEQYDYQYDKTSPETMVQLYRNAGLNPGLMYSGNAGSGVRASMGSSSVGSLSPFNGSVYTDPAMIANIDNIKADTDLKSSAADLNDEKTKTEKLEQINKEIEQAQRRLDLAKTDDERAKIRAEIKVLENQAELINSQRVTEDDLRDVRKREISSKADVNVTNAEANRIANRFANHTFDSRANKLSYEATIAELEKNYIEKWQEKMPSAGVPGAVAMVAHALAGSHAIRSSDLDNPANMKGILSKDYVRSLVPDWLHPVVDHILNGENVFDKDYFLWDYIRMLRGEN